MSRRRRSIRHNEMTVNKTDTARGGEGGGNPSKDEAPSNSEKRPENEAKWNPFKTKTCS